MFTSLAKITFKMCFYGIGQAQKFQRRLWIFKGTAKHLEYEVTAGPSIPCHLGNSNRSCRRAVGTEPSNWTAASPRLGWGCGSWGCSSAAPPRIWVGGLGFEPAGSAWGDVEGSAACQGIRGTSTTSLFARGIYIPSPIPSPPPQAWISISCTELWWK